MTASPLPLFLQLLADSKLQPGGVRLVFSEPEGDALPPQTEHPDNDAFTAFAACFPCLIDSKEALKLHPLHLQALLGKGCQLPSSELIQRCDAPQKPVLSNKPLWLDGNWYQAPPAKPTDSQLASRTLALRLVQLVAADADTREIEDVFRQDPTLSYHLLRVVNSLNMGTNRRIASFSQAILMLGRQQLRRWLNLMLFAPRPDDPRSAMLLAQVAVRARSMELLARLAGLDRAMQELAFMAGMFSMLGILFGMSLTDLFKPLQMSDLLVDAVLRREGDTGQLLQAVEFSEQADAQSLMGVLRGLRLTEDQFKRVNLEAHQWMRDMVRGTQESAHG